MTGAPSRPGFDDWGLLLAAAVSVRGDCTRKQVGAVILDSRNRVVITGYNGAPPGGPSCLAGACPRGRHYLAPRLDASTAAQCICGVPWPCALAVQPSSSYDTGPGLCIAVHAEMNSIIYADPARLPGATIYVTDEPCTGCARMIAGAGIARTVWGPPSADAIEALSMVLAALALEPRVLRDVSLASIVLRPGAVPYEDTPPSTMANDREGTP